MDVSLTIFEILMCKARKQLFYLRHTCLTKPLRICLRKSPFEVISIIQQVATVMPTRAAPPVYCYTVTTGPGDWGHIFETS